MWGRSIDERPQADCLSGIDDGSRPSVASLAATRVGRGPALKRSEDAVIRVLARVSPRALEGGGHALYATP